MKNITKDTSFKNENETPVPPMDQRPVCAGCGRHRKVWRFRGEWHYKGYKYFCTLRCATRFANNIIEGKVKK